MELELKDERINSHKIGPILGPLPHLEYGTTFIGKAGLIPAPSGFKPLGEEDSQRLIKSLKCLIESKGISDNG